jgi:kinesin family protein 15
LLQKQALVAEQETEKAYQEIDNLKKNYDQEILALKQRLTESSQCKDDTLRPHEPNDLEPRYDTAGNPSGQEFNTLQQGGSLEVSKSTDLNSWFYGYDKCNI